MTKLSVNLNKIALLRNARDIGIPSVTKAAHTCIDAGVGGITVHPRPDQRHIRYSDVYELKDIIVGSGLEFNIEGNPFTGRYMEVVRQVLPTQATLVPDAPGANTSDHGWNFNQEGTAGLKEVIKTLRSLGIRVSLFVDPDIASVEGAAQLGADRVELYTEPYARAFSENNNLEGMIRRYAEAARKANEAALGVNAGHDLNLDNLPTFCKNVEPVEEVSIGHALIADAIEMGLSEAIRAYLEILKKI